jgi:hypothetical protein
MGGVGAYSPIQDVTPNAVRMAEPIDTIICTTNFVVSFLVILMSSEF